MRNKMKFWRRIAADVKRVMVKMGKHTKGARYGRSCRVAQELPQWKGGPALPILASPLLMAMLKDSGYSYGGQSPILVD